MVDKTQRTVYINTNNDRFLAEADNASAVVNDLVEQFRKNGKGREMAALQLRLNQKLRELENARENVDRLETDVEEIKTLMEEAQNANSDALEEAKEALNRIDEEDLDRENPAVEHWAEKTGMTPTQLLKEVGCSTQ